MPHHRFLMLLTCLVLLISPEQAGAVTDDEAIAQVQTINQAFTAIARRVTPSVVTVSTKVKAQAQQGRRIPNQFHPFFPQFPYEVPERNRPGLGSGIIMTAQGHILTNNHVAGEADEITVILSDNREFPATLVGRDSLTDVAVIRIDATDLTPARVGNSDGIQIGEWVLAVGAPMGLRFRSTVTSGIVSALGRSLEIISEGAGFAVEDFIQTDAAINPGNSGGALVNTKGEVVGVNTAIASQTGQFVGYGFAIPINLAKKVMDDIIAYGKVRRGYLGVTLRQVAAGEAEAFGLDRPRGVLIENVFDNTPAQKAQLKPGDIVLSLNGEPVDRPNHIQSLIARRHPGDEVALSVRRGDRTVEVRVTLNDIPENGTLASAPSEGRGSERTGELGLSLSDLTPDLAQSLGMDAGTEGVVVTDVNGGPARDAGFSRGDLIFAVRQGGFDMALASVKDFRTALARLQKGRAAAFSILRKDPSGAERRLYITLRIPA